MDLHISRLSFRMPDEFIGQIREFRITIEDLLTFKIFEQPKDLEGKLVLELPAVRIDDLNRRFAFKLDHVLPPNMWDYLKVSVEKGVQYDRYDWPPPPSDDTDCCGLCAPSRKPHGFLKPQTRIIQLCDDSESFIGPPWRETPYYYKNYSSCEPTPHVYHRKYRKGQEYRYKHVSRKFYLPYGIEMYISFRFHENPESAKLYYNLPSDPKKLQWYLKLFTQCHQSEIRKLTGLAGPSGKYKYKGEFNENAGPFSGSRYVAKQDLDLNYYMTSLRPEKKDKSVAIISVVNTELLSREDFNKKYVEGVRDS